MAALDDETLDQMYAAVDAGVIAGSDADEYIAQAEADRRRQIVRRRNHSLADGFLDAIREAELEAEAEAQAEAEAEAGGAVDSTNNNGAG